MIKPYFKSSDKNFYLLHGDTMELLSQFEHKFDMVFADPPYFLSNNGLSIQSGKIVSVNKGNWDKSGGFDAVNEFNRQWLSLVKDKLKDNGTIWISGTMHNIFSIAQILQELDFKILNAVTWQKTNPPPNFSCRFFTHSTEQIIWARKMPKVPHYYNYELMKELNGGKQMKDVWELPAIATWEKKCGKHPTQKPLAVLTRAILASTKPNAWVLDPFAGSSTTGIAANLLGRRYVGIDQEKPFLEISKNRKLEIEDETVFENYLKKIKGFNDKKELTHYLDNEPQPEKKIALGYCKKQDIDNIANTNKFYFHAIEQDNFVRDFPIGITDAESLYLYQGSRSKPKTFTGHFGKIKEVKLKHKSKIKGKAKSKTEFYYEVELHENFQFNSKLIQKIKITSLFDSQDNYNKDLFKRHLPSLASKKLLFSKD